MSRRSKRDLVAVGRSAAAKFSELADELELLSGNAMPANLSKGTVFSLSSIVSRLRQASASVLEEIGQPVPDPGTILLDARKGRRAASLAASAVATGLLVGIGTGAGTAMSGAALDELTSARTASDAAVAAAENLEGCAEERGSQDEDQTWAGHITYSVDLFYAGRGKPPVEDDRDRAHYLRTITRMKARLLARYTDFDSAQIAGLSGHDVRSVEMMVERRWHSPRIRSSQERGDYEYFVRLLDVAQLRAQGVPIRSP